MLERHSSPIRWSEARPCQQGLPGPTHGQPPAHALARRRALSAVPLALIIHGRRAVDCRGSRATLWILILGSGDDKGPAYGPVTGVPRAPEAPSLDSWDGPGAGQWACGRGLIHAQAGSIG